MQKSFAEIIQQKIEKENKRRQKSQNSLCAAILAANQNGAKSGPILLSSLVSKKSNQ
jgi:hypothetical protein